MATAAELTALRTAIATGALEVVTGDGKKVRYRSLDDMIRIERWLTKQIAGASDPDPTHAIASWKRGS